MSTLEAWAPAKVNLCLFLGGRREDGRHELVTLFDSVSLADKLSLTVLAGDSGPRSDQVLCPGVPEPNLVSSALAGLRSRGWDAPPVRIEVLKRIPVAAGMGGGSADAAAALRLAVEIAPGRPEEVSALAAQLGADVPSQLVPGLVLGTGAGEIVQPFAPLCAHAFVIAPQPFALSTAAVYAEADRLGLARDSGDVEERYNRLVASLAPGARLPGALLVNDLEPAAVSLCPAIVPALRSIRGAGAENVFVCGSGPTVAGVFWGPDARDRANAAVATLGAKFPGAQSALPVTAEFGIPRFA